MIDLSTLPEPTFVTVNYDDQYKALRAAYEQAVGVPLSKGQVESLILATFEYRENLLRIAINNAGKQNLLAYAKGSMLDHLGALLGTARLQPAPATATLRFTFEGPLPAPLDIPEGTRVMSKDQAVTFRCAHVTALAGQSTIDTSATCIEAGEVGNGYLTGDISLLIDPLPYVSTVENTGTSSGGADVEDDDRFRSRIQLAPESFSVAGPVGAYQYWAKQAHEDVVDVAVWSPDPGTVRVAPLLKDGQLPDQPMMDLISAALNADKVRPLTDFVVVVQPRIVSYSIEAQLYLYQSFSTLRDTVLDQANKAVTNYTELLSCKLGADIVPEQIVGQLQKISGVYRAVVVAPTYTALDPDQVALCSGITISIAGSVNG